MLSRAVHSALALACLGIATPASAQDTPPPRGVDPRLWVSASYGPVVFPQLNYLNNASRNNISSALSPRGTIELDIGRVGSLGFTYATASYDVNYVVTRQDDPCVPGCDATLNSTSLLATLRVGGGLGLEQVFEVSAGYTMFDELESSQPLYNARPSHNDFTAAVGYGATYGFSPALSAMVIADIGLAFHDNPNDEVQIEGGYYSHFIGIRAGLRYGFWNR